MDGEGVSVIGSQSYLVDVASRKKRFWRSRTAVERRLKIVALALVLLVVGLVVALSVVAAMNAKNKLEVSCTSERCLKSASMLLEGMDTSVDPCQDFYAFTCNNWPKNHPPDDATPFNSRLVEASAKIERDLQRVLEDVSRKNKYFVNLPLNQARIFYRSCMDEDSSDRTGVSDVVALLKYMGLPGELPSTSTLTGFSLSRSLALAKRLLDMAVVLQAGLTFENGKVSPKNQLYLAMAPASRRSTTLIPMDKIEGEYLLALQSYASGIMTLFNDAQPLKRRHNDSSVRLMALETIMFDRNIEMMQSKIRSNGLGMESTNVNMREMQRFLDNGLTVPLKMQLNIKEYVTYLMRGFVEGFPSENQRIVFIGKEHIFKIVRIFAETRELTVQRYVWWKVVETLAPYTTREARRLHDKMRLFEDPSYIRPPRSTYCVQLTCNLMPDVVKHAMSVVHPVEDKVVEVRRMLGNIQAALGELMRRAEWMSAATRDKALTSLAALKWLVGYSPLHTNENEVVKKMKKLEMYSNSFCENICLITMASVSITLERISKRAIEKDDDEAWNSIGVLELDAYYIEKVHAIVVPPSILQSPLYNRGLEVLNYGTLGVILGQELTKTYGPKGLKFNNKDDGSKKLAEKTVDYGGVRVSFMAYQMYVKGLGREVLLIGFENFTHEQLFFLAYTNWWCGSLPVNDWDAVVLKNRNILQRAWVTDVLSKTPEFAGAWHCANDSAMRPPPS